MKKMNRELASKAFEKFYVPKANDKKLIKSEILFVIKDALENYGIAVLTGKDVSTSKSPLDMFLMIDDNQIKISISNPKDDYRDKYKFLNNEEVNRLELLQDRLN